MHPHQSGRSPTQAGSTAEAICKNKHISPGNVGWGEPCLQPQGIAVKPQECGAPNFLNLRQ